MNVLEMAVEKVRDETRDVDLRDAEGAEVYR
jgi:hypothetical protein